MLDTHYQDPRLVDLYDLDSGWCIDRDFYLSLAGPPPQKILDLGCGTGLICNAYAELGHTVTGVDPSRAMLEVARRKLHASKIEWVHSSAEMFHSESLFNLVIMTGHAFQALLDESSVLKTLAVMRKHLDKDGYCIFESRNPSVDWESRWDYEMVLNHNGEKIRELRKFTGMADGRMTFDLIYQFANETLVSKSELRFWFRGEIEDKARASGLEVAKVLGGWHGEEFDEPTSEEMIFFLQPIQSS